jgi:multidrug resistance protein
MSVESPLTSQPTPHAAHARPTGGGETKVEKDGDQASAARRLMPVLFVGVFMAALDTAVIGPAIPALRAAFHVDNRAIGLVMSVFILFSLCSTALMANLSDRYGRRPIYLVSVACFALGSLLIALSPRFWMIIASRAVQGIGAGGITPTASAVVGDSFPPEARGRALGLIGATYGMAFVLGPPLAALLLVALTWRWIFLINLPIAALVLVLGLRVLPSTRAAGSLPALDRSGILVTFLLLACVVLGITRVADEVWGALLWPWFLAATAVLVVALIAVERRAAQPLIPLSLFANPELAVTYGLAVGAGFGMGSIIFVSSIATSGYGVSANHVGFVLLPLVLGSMFGSMGAGRLLNRLGARTLLLVGFALLTAGYAALSVTSYGLWAFLAASVPVGLGLGVVVGGAMRAIAIEEAPQALRGAAQGLINIGNAIGTLLAAAAISVIADAFGRGVDGFGLAYRVVAAVLLLMFVLAFALRKGRTPPSRLQPGGSHD